MFKHFFGPLSVLFLTALLLSNCGKEGPEGGSDIDDGTSYSNPVSELPLPDPTVIRGDDGKFYLVSSDEGVKGLPIMRSANLVDWERVGQVFNAGARPKLDGRTDGGLWAPDLARIGKKYVLYYAYYSTQGEMKWGIGAATADRPSGPWTDKGKLFLGEEIGVRCSIDPCYYYDDGKHWLVWGSYYGIWAVELSDDGLSVKEGAEKIHLAGVDGYGLEGAMIYKKDGKYYLFVSEGGTGYTENYKLGAARSDRFLGPYLNKAGQDVATAPVDFFMSAGNGFVSPGHCSEIITDAKGDDWILFHAFVQGEKDKGRRLMLDKLVWTGGWPSITDMKPSQKSARPSF